MRVYVHLKTNIVILIVIACILSACTSLENTHISSISANTTEASIKNTQFEAYKKEFIEELWKQNPSWALFSGYYKYDDQLVIPTTEHRNQELQNTKQALAQLQLKFNPNKLSNSDASDYYILENALKSNIWYTEKFKSYTWNPATYNVARAFGLILNTDYKEFDERLRTISKRMQNIPAYYAAAKENISNPTLEHTVLAIQQNQGALEVFGENLKQKVADSGLSAGEQKHFDAHRRAALQAINSYLEWLQVKESDLRASDSARSFRIGKELYSQKYQFDIETEYTADEIYSLALQEKERLHTEMIKVSHGLWNKYFTTNKPDNDLVMVKKLITEISKQHTQRDNFVQAIKEQIPTLVEFVNTHDLLDQDPSKPLVVRETPKYQRGIAGASINSPGPYDPDANTYYNVTPLDSYDEIGAESYLREYNDRMLQILNIHEAIPGHYTQLVHANKSPSLIKSILRNGAMIEGWAVYTERMMLEEGYGNNEPELWLMWYKWNMRVVMNTILDYSIHTLGLTEEQALALMIDQAFQEESEAKAKWRRLAIKKSMISERN